MWKWCSRRFQLEERPIRGLLRDCETLRTTVYTLLRSRKKKKLVKRPVDVLQEMRDIYKEEEDNLQGADMIEKVENYLRQDKS